MESTTRTPREQRDRSADSAREKAAVKDGLDAMASLVRRHSASGKATDAATKAAARHVDISLSGEVRELIERLIAARSAVLDSPADDDPQPGGLTARQIVNAFVDPAALTRLISP